VVEEMAPTLGKFYVKASNGQNYGLWGNFKVGYVGNELAHVDRGLYGANGHYATESTTSFGERRLALDGFAAQPGTMPSYEQFRGTGGSLYYLHHQDLLGGSERVRIELRGQGLRHRDRRGQPATGHGLRHRLPAGPAAAVGAALLDRQRQPARAHERHER
jgi:hypothetical protein